MMIEKLSWVAEVLALLLGISILLSGLVLLVVAVAAIVRALYREFLS